MSEAESRSAASLRQWQMALSRWDNEGGAGPAGSQRGAVSGEAQSKILQLTNAELMQLGSVHTVMLHYVHALHRGPPRRRSPGRVRRRPNGGARPQRRFWQSAGLADQAASGEAFPRCQYHYNEPWSGGNHYAPPAASLS
jgi:hypothetical protein